VEALCAALAEEAERAKRRREGFRRGVSLQVFHPIHHLSRATRSHSRSVRQWLLSCVFASLG
jgi:hypothetical protein